MSGKSSADVEDVPRTCCVVGCYHRVQDIARSRVSRPTAVLPRLFLLPNFYILYQDHVPVHLRGPPPTVLHRLCTVTAAV